MRNKKGIIRYKYTCEMEGRMKGIYGGMCDSAIMKNEFRRSINKEFFMLDNNKKKDLIGERFRMYYYNCI